MWPYKYLSGVNMWASELINHATTERSEKNCPGWCLNVLSCVHHSLVETWHAWEYVSLWPLERCSKGLAQLQCPEPEHSELGWSKPPPLGPSPKNVPLLARRDGICVCPHQRWGHWWIAGYGVRGAHHGWDAIPPLQEVCQPPGHDVGWHHVLHGFGWPLLIGEACVGHVWWGLSGRGATWAQTQWVLGAGGVWHFRQTDIRQEKPLRPVPRNDCGCEGPTGTWHAGGGARNAQPPPGLRAFPEYQQGVPGTLCKIHGFSGIPGTSGVPKEVGRQGLFGLGRRTIRQSLIMGDEVPSHERVPGLLWQCVCRPIRAWNLTHRMLDCGLWTWNGNYKKRQTTLGGPGPPPY